MTGTGILHPSLDYTYFLNSEKPSLFSSPRYGSESWVGTKHNGNSVGEHNARQQNRGFWIVVWSSYPDKLSEDECRDH